MKAIDMISLTKYYGKSRGIVDLNLTVDEGDFFGFIGPNGAGKSTTIRTLLGLISPTSGSATILGHDIRRQKNKVLDNTGYMPSEATFYHNMKVQDIIRLSADLRKKDCHKEAAALCERLDLDTEKKISELSLGNRKKVSIVCALQHKPKLCILDEPTSGLDPLMQREFYEILKERNDAGTTIFLSSHVLSEIQRYCKKAAVIREGKILVADTIENISHAEAKRITIKGVTAPPTALENMKDITFNEDMVSFLYAGDMAILLEQLAKLPLTDVTITEPDLEEIFMHYYTKEENNHDTPKA